MIMIHQIMGIFLFLMVLWQVSVAFVGIVVAVSAVCCWDQEVNRPCLVWPKFLHEPRSNMLLRDSPLVCGKFSEPQPSHIERSHADLLEPI